MMGLIQTMPRLHTSHTPLGRSTSRLVNRLWRNPRTRRAGFRRREMVRDHAEVNDQALALVKKLGVAPEANGTSAALSEEAKQQMRKLNGLDGAAFDKAYVQNEIAYHRTVNDALSGTLIPGRHTHELKSTFDNDLTLLRD